MRIVTWNIQFGIEVDRAIADLRDREELERADIVLLQEMDERGTRAVADALDAEFAFAAADLCASTGRQLGNAIVSKWPITDAVEIDLPHTAPVNGQPRSAIRAGVEVADQPVLAYSVHSETVLLPLPWRIAQWKTVAADVAARTERRVVVGGDFNTGTRRDVRALRRVMSDVGLHPASRDSGETFRRFGRGFVLDHVFSSAMETTAVASISTFASDHYALAVDVDTTPTDPNGR